MPTPPLCLAAPDSWSRESTESFRAALCLDIPVRTTPVEENTLPSWLWRRQAFGAAHAKETSVFQVVDRLAGSAAYVGWKKGLWRDESEARAFYETVRSLLLDRRMAFDPAVLANVGVDWAYGIKSLRLHKTARTASMDLATGLPPTTKTVVTARNATIDSVVGKTSPELNATWRKFLGGSKDATTLTLKFSDTSDEWNENGNTNAAPRIMLDLLKFYDVGQGFQLAHLQKATRAATVLLDLHYDALTTRQDPSRALAIGFANLAPLLMAMGIPYASETGRATAAAIGAIVTAESVITSSELAETLGPCPAYAALREQTLRTLRNHSRAVHGERNDYERISILPVSLEVDSGADLVFMAAARRLWSEALEQAQTYGLRHLQFTDLFACPAIAACLGCTTQGIEPETNLVIEQSAPTTAAAGESETDLESYVRVLNPALTLALQTAGCESDDFAGIAAYALGAGTLQGAPAITPQTLRDKGFTKEILSLLDRQLPRVRHIRHAFTPWILGEAFCRNTLHIRDEDLLNPGFDILQHMGFTPQAIESANAYCCGRKTVLGSSELPPQLAPVFAQDNAAQDARILMAAAVQSVITGDTHANLTLPATASLEDRENLVLASWMKGLKSVTLSFDSLFDGLARLNERRFSPPANDRPMAKPSKSALRKFAKPALPTTPVPMPSSRTRTSQRMTSASSLPANNKPKATPTSLSLARAEKTRSDWTRKN